VLRLVRLSFSCAVPSVTKRGSVKTHILCRGGAKATSFISSTLMFVNFFGRLPGSKTLKGAARQVSGAGGAS